MSGKLVGIISPFSGDTKRNIAYAQKACASVLAEGDFPYASHLFYPQMLDDSDEESRNLGLIAGRAFYRVCDKIYVFPELGISPGMLGDLACCLLAGKHICP